MSNEYIRDNIHAYFCSQSCLYDFLNTHRDRVVAIQPRREALETPIKIVKEQQTGRRYNYETGTYADHTYMTQTIVNKVINET